MVTTPFSVDAAPSSLPQSAPYKGGLQRNVSGLGHAVSNGFVKWTSLVQPNYAAVLHGVNDMRFEEFPLASTLKEGSVRIEIKAVGICGSDVHYWKRVGPRIVWSCVQRIAGLQESSLYRGRLPTLLSGNQW